MRARYGFYMVLLFLTVCSFLMASDWYEARITSPSPFMGNNGELFKLNDGSTWEVKYEFNYLYAYYPLVLVSPKQGKLILDGKKLSIKKISSGDNTSIKINPDKETQVIESRIDGAFKGWNGDTIVKLTNGQVWQQSQYYYKYRYSFMPEVMIIKTGNSYKMLVDGIDKSVGVKRIK